MLLSSKKKIKSKNPFQSKKKVFEFKNVVETLKKNAFEDCFSLIEKGVFDWSVGFLNIFLLWYFIAISYYGQDICVFTMQSKKVLRTKKN